ncbi:tyrosine-type recombinase/integrase [Aliivibrio sp. S4TY2]|uniref:tyrosine-type recombinase/integrase n=1 Tax=unclassified Aliivibrio TaxID=2645654 RepID=UPI00237948E3|nr:MULTISPECIES: tyrosine-type recombinase/integrase [unclassified Aliivibrio]MDD9156719.1 tyrosine-type recombinase/integrase [Aliivibrio sp. S4TY2]MDD9160205.1 tyrosine-type recombinase/integrase [Aliivibrio sp. S4TY1]MDD9164503.1 tyrosine-type recombinase/integrase [Aliivibrio sp. S4MY2]MDD9168628.1 tyrosine-type recombinase/integrase [Aliivibrio sp. S4MY4]MDD9184837.1 tyrosine-type recombinase/integrase [Aliivibrio sp. S4MY3]
MYLFRAPNSTYYTRICLPKSLRDNGFPFDLKISLLTKRRDEAVDRNFILVPQLRKLIDDAFQECDASTFRNKVDELVNQVRDSFTLRDTVRLPVRQMRTASSLQSQTVTMITSPATKTKTIITVKKAFAKFIISKQHVKVRPLTIEQLKQRTEHFLSNLTSRCVSQVTSADAVRFRDRLYQEGRSYKTNKDYLASCRQFFKWCKQMKYVTDNPFQDITVQEQAKKKSQDEERERWSITDLVKLYRSTAFQSKPDEFRLITTIMLYQGLRPSEACQLRVADICNKEGIDCFLISEDGQDQHIKTASSLRYVPIHPLLIEKGFLDYVANRKAARCIQLFNYKPDGKWQDWSKRYCQQFGRLQTAIGMPANARPTAYSFRHTFIDELKQKGIEESLVAQIVGHTHQSMTFGRYGKKYPMQKLATVIRSVTFLELENSREMI